MNKQKKKFSGEKINVTWDGQLCIHIAECGKSQGDLFVAGRAPWCQPDVVSVDDVIDIVKRCPTGALSFDSTDSSIVETVAVNNTVIVSYNGPYFIRGDLEFEAQLDEKHAITHRAALCRCGASKNKPFCDNSHEQIGFKDYGAVGDKGADLQSAGGRLTIKPVKDGPLMLHGNIMLSNGSGCVAWTGKEIALCRCGASKNKPFCDGSHTAIGFKSAK